VYTNLNTPEFKFIVLISNYKRNSILKAREFIKLIKIELYYIV